MIVAAGEEFSWGVATSGEEVPEQPYWLMNHCGDELRHAVKRRREYGTGAYRE